MCRMIPKILYIPLAMDFLTIKPNNKNKIKQLCS